MGLSFELEGAASAVLADVDSNNNLFVSEQLPEIGSAGGWYTVTGQTSVVVPAALAQNTAMMSMRMSPTSTRKAYLVSYTLTIAISTVTISGSSPAIIGLVRMSGTPTAGTARTVNRLSEAIGADSDMTDVRDSNGGLTVTNAVFGRTLSGTKLPITVTSGPTGILWEYKPKHPIVMLPNQGIALRLIEGTPGTQTWVYAYTAVWYEK